MTTKTLLTATAIIAILLVAVPAEAQTWSGQIVNGEMHGHGFCVLLTAGSQKAQ